MKPFISPKEILLKGEILDAILIANEKKDDQERSVVFKIDFERTYDYMG